MQRQQFVKIPDHGITNNFDGNHLNVLYALCRYFSYFKENRVNTYRVKDLAEMCQKSERRIYSSLDYLRKNMLLIKIGKHWFINPFICFKCKEAEWEDIVDFVINNSGLSKEQLIPRMKTFEYDFRNIQSAKDEPDEEKNQPAQKPTVRQWKVSTRSYYDGAIEEDEDYDYDDEQDAYDEDQEQEAYFK